SRHDRRFWLRRMQTGMWPARGSPGDSRLAPVPPAHPDTAGKTSPLHSSEESAGRSATWLGGREETLLPQIAWELARQDPSMVPGTRVKAAGIQTSSWVRRQPDEVPVTPSAARPPRTAAS